MTILQSLKKLHKKMTGQDTTSKTISDVLDSIQKNYAVQPGGDDNEFIVTADIIPGVDTFEVDNLSAGLDEIITAAKDNKPVRLHAAYDNDGTDLVLDAYLSWYVDVSDNSPTAVFSGVFTLPDSIANAIIVVSTDSASVLVYPMNNASLPDPETAGNVLTSTGTGWESAPPTVNKMVIDFVEDDGIFYPVDTSISDIITAFNNDNIIVGRMETNFALLDAKCMLCTSDSVIFTATMYETEEDDLTDVILVGAVADNTDQWLPPIVRKRLDALILQGVENNGEMTVSGASWLKAYYAAKNGRDVNIDVDTGEGFERYHLSGYYYDTDTNNYGFTFYLVKPRIDSTPTNTVKTVYFMTGQSNGVIIEKDMA